MNQKLDIVTGAIAISIAGFTAVLTPDDARAWGELLLDYSPLVLIGVLLLRIRAQDKRIKEQNTKLISAEIKYSELQDKLLLTYASMIKGTKRSKLPTTQQFRDGEFDIEECIEDCAQAMRT